MSAVVLMLSIEYLATFEDGLNSTTRSRYVMVQSFAKGDTLTAYHASITGQAFGMRQSTVEETHLRRWFRDFVYGLSGDGTPRMQPDVCSPFGVTGIAGFWGVGLRGSESSSRRHA